MGTKGREDPSPENTKLGGLEGALLGFGGREEMGEVVGLRSVVGFLLHPTWRGKKQTQRETGMESTRTEKKRETHTREGTKKERDTRGKTDRRPREAGRETSWKGKVETRT